MKYPIPFAVNALTAAMFLTPVAYAAAPAPVCTPTLCEMPSDSTGKQPFDVTPSAVNSPTQKVLKYGSVPRLVTSGANIPVPVKTLKITNNSTTQTVYPIMIDPNDTCAEKPPAACATSLYDPYDLRLQEYRGYIGHEGDGKNGEKSGTYYFGLKPGHSITLSVPLVFWNGGRIVIGTEAKYIIPAGDDNPLNYQPNSTISITPADQSKPVDPSKPDSDGVVMWYNYPIPQGIQPDSADQLAEWTIRDHDFLANDDITKKLELIHSQIPDNQLVNLINYDVSNVDDLYLPLAMEAANVWVTPQGIKQIPGDDKCPDPNTLKDPNRPCWQAGQKPEPYGWTGSADKGIDDLQKSLHQFTKDSDAQGKTLIGQYFGGKGWPFYNIPGSDPTKPNSDIKIPGGANIFAQSPGHDVLSSYGGAVKKYMLSSGGTEPIFKMIGAANDPNDPVGSTTIHLSKAASNYTDVFKFIQTDYVVTASEGTTAPGTKVLKKNVDLGTVTIQPGLKKPSFGQVFTFSRPNNDYASDAMIRLWFSWAEHYLQNWKNQNPQALSQLTGVTASINKNSPFLILDKERTDLVEGMAVEGPGLDDARTEVGPHQGDAIILEVGSDHKTLILSQVANKSSTLDGRFKIGPPPELIWKPKTGQLGDPLIPLKFPPADPSDPRNPDEFAKQVYLIMASMNQIDSTNNSDVFKFMQDVIGANMGYIFTEDATLLDDTQMVMGMIRDKIKSVLRGVHDFQKFPEVDSQGKRVWYPDPAEPTGGTSFNVFNLDPFVWFVHVQLGFSGYGFSVDDDTADVGAGGGDPDSVKNGKGTQLQITIPGKGGLNNKNIGLDNKYQWSIQAPYGPVKKVSVYYSGPATASNGDTIYHDVTGVEYITTLRITMKDAHHFTSGETVKCEQMGAADKANGTFKIDNVSKTAFDIRTLNGQPVGPTGKYISGGRCGSTLHAYIDTKDGPKDTVKKMPGNDLNTVFYRVKGDEPDGTFKGTFVTVEEPNIKLDANRKPRVWQLGEQDHGRLILDNDLYLADGKTKLQKGVHIFTFFEYPDSIKAANKPPVTPLK